MRSKDGFSIYELMVVIGIFAIISVIALPPMMNWRGRAKINDAVRMVKADLEFARITAIQKNEFVVVMFNVDSYSIFLDNGAGGAGAGNWVHDPGEKRLRSRKLPAGVRVDLGNTNFEGDQTTRFNGRGRLDEKGVVTLAGSNGTQRELNMNNRFGRIDIS